MRTRCATTPLTLLTLPTPLTLHAADAARPAARGLFARPGRPAGRGRRVAPLRALPFTGQPLAATPQWCELRFYHRERELPPEPGPIYCFRPPRTTTLGPCSPAPR